jgi:hypothetical protein
MTSFLPARYSEATSEAKGSSFLGMSFMDRGETFWRYQSAQEWLKSARRNGAGKNLNSREARGSRPFFWVRPK